MNPLQVNPVHVRPQSQHAGSYLAVVLSPLPPFLGLTCGDAHLVPVGSSGGNSCGHELPRQEGYAAMHHLQSASECPRCTGPSCPPCKQAWATWPSPVLANTLLWPCHQPHDLMLRGPLWLRPCAAGGHPQLPMYLLPPAGMPQLHP